MLFRGNVVRGNVFTGNFAFGEMVQGVMVRGETIIRGFVQGRTGNFGKVTIAARLFLYNARLLRMCGILKIFSENLRLFFKLM
jgi:hypothetical protein